MFKGDYWIAIATVAPVLALANTVTLTHWARNWIEYRAAKAAREAELPGEKKPVPFWFASRGRCFACWNFWLQVLVTATALFSLEARRNALSPLVVTVLITVSFGVIVMLAESVGSQREQTFLLTHKRERLPPVEPDSDPEAV